ncbi:Alpha-trehalose glucohydrolase [Dirofilaria immitis]|nr:Alpha-trehalose glucohydrolase [Dirofilaria immitis]
MDLEKMDPMMTVEEIQEQHETRKRIIEEKMMRLESYLESLETTNKEWKQYIQQIFSPEKRREEEEKHAQMVNDETERNDTISKSHNSEFAPVTVRVYSTIKQRTERLKELKVCLNCFDNSHKTTDCKSRKRSCFYCKGPHNPALCEKKYRGHDEPNKEEANTLRYWCANIVCLKKIGAKLKLEVGESGVIRIASFSSKYPTSSSYYTTVGPILAGSGDATRPLKSRDATRPPKFNGVTTISNCKDITPASEWPQRTSTTVSVNSITAEIDRFWKLEKWNCEEVETQNSTSITITVYTPTHVRIPAIRCNNVTRTSIGQSKEIKGYLVDPNILEQEISLLRQKIEATSVKPTERKVDDNLLVAPCNSGNITQNTVEFKSGIISKFEIERINAEIETLAAKQKTINSVPHQQNMETIWQEISQEGKELAEQLDDEIGKATLLIQNELSEFALHWRMITGGTSDIVTSDGKSMDTVIHENINKGEKKFPHDITANDTEAIRQFIDENFEEEGHELEKYDGGLFY